MAKNVYVTVSSEKTDQIISELKTYNDLFEIQVYRNASIKPPGDIIKMAMPNSAINKIMRILDRYRTGEKDGISVSTSSPSSYISEKSAVIIERDNSEATWEEILMTIRNDSNTSVNTLAMMFMSGCIAVAGLFSNSLHIVVAGMLIAPGFMPISRIALGMVAKTGTWKYGFYDLLKGYSLMITGAAFSFLLLSLSDYKTDTPAYYITGKSMVDYWTTFSIPSILASSAASIAGALILATRKSVFTSGVMIGLALVPAAVIIPVSVLSGDFQSAGKAFLRFAADAFMILAFSLAVFSWIRFHYSKRDLKT